MDATVADLTVSRLLKRWEGGKKEGTGEKTERGMICGHWAKESHTSIHLCQGWREELERRKDEMEECGEQKERELTKHLTTCSIFRAILGVCVYVSVCSKYGAVRASQESWFEHSSVAV